MDGTSTKKRFLFIIVCNLFVATLLFTFCEAFVRWKGFESYVGPEQKQVMITAEPGGKLFQKHPTLGYTHIPGEFTVTLPGPAKAKLSFHVTHLDSTLRITHSLETYTASQPKPEIWILGCSLTHGWSLNDEETYPWLVQMQFPDYEVVNFGVSGYGTIHSLIEVQEALQIREKPKLVILAYSSRHDIRNAFTRRRRKSVAPWNKLGPLVQPYGRLDKNGKLQVHMADVIYQEAPFMRYSAFIHFLEDTYNNKEDAYLHVHDISKAIIRELNTLCKTNDVKLVLAGIEAIEETMEMLDFAQQEGILSTNISVDLSLPGYTNAPFDPHPSAMADREMARKLIEFLGSSGALRSQEPRNQ
ncbi:MAG: SGNH/GDSL hydrolase family protein [Acidobacteria bacterium]|nr:SGNH/GDSL hydrolase family protein [Acidobacteriota bacterium]MBI3655589.1 SGNH/GDSL hydrolase family protein [Acidobacteriota bacterium]